MSNALQGLLELSTRSIQYLKLCDITLGEEFFRPIAQGLINGSIVTEITLNNCTFIGEGSIFPLNQVLERKQNLRSLAIKICIFNRPWFQWDSLPQFLEVLFSALRWPASPLRHFQFGDRSSDRLSTQRFSNLCDAVAVSKLDSFFCRED